jgi:hypothetical protein
MCDQKVKYELNILMNICKVMKTILADVQVWHLKVDRFIGLSWKNVLKVTPVCICAF